VACAGAFAGAATLAGASGCSSILGLGDITESSCVGSECDGGSDAPAGDGGDDADAGDGKAEACVPVTVIDPSTIDAAACPPSDGGCAPGPVDAAALHWVPQRVQPGTCTAGTIQDFYSSCVDVATRNQPACGAFESTYAPCNMCLTSNIGDPSYGVLIDIAVGGGIDTLLNTSDCIMALDPCNEPCARVREALIQCVVAACIGSCPVLADFQACTHQAAMCGECSAYFYSADDCGVRLAAAKSPAQTCVTQQGSFEANLLELGGPACVMP
jgi:hypothetical protein